MKSAVSSSAASVPQEAAKQRSPNAWQNRLKEAAKRKQVEEQQQRLDSSETQEAPETQEEINFQSPEELITEPELPSLLPGQSDKDELSIEMIKEEGDFWEKWITHGYTAAIRELSDTEELAKARAKLDKKAEKEQK